MAHPTDTIYQSCDQWALPQREMLYDTVIDLKAQTVLEIGTNIGDSTRILSTALKETGGHLYSLDSGGCRDAWYLKWDCSNITFITDNSLSVPWDKELDLLLVDGGHEFATCKSDLTRFGPWVRVGGHVLVHDTRLQGVQGDIRRAIYEWTAETLLPWTEYPHGVGLGIIRMLHSLPR